MPRGIHLIFLVEGNHSELKIKSHGTELCAEQLGFCLGRTGTKNWNTFGSYTDGKVVNFTVPKQWKERDKFLTY